MIYTTTSMYTIIEFICYHQRMESLCFEQPITIILVQERKK